jgi:hypothetical protein
LNCQFDDNIVARKAVAEINTRRSAEPFRVVAKGSGRRIFEDMQQEELAR